MKLTLSVRTFIHDHACVHACNYVHPQITHTYILTPSLSCILTSTHTLTYPHTQLDTESFGEQDFGEQDFSYLTPKRHAFRLGCAQSVAYSIIAQDTSVLPPPPPPPPPVMHLHTFCRVWLFPWQWRVGRLLPRAVAAGYCWRCAGDCGRSVNFSALAAITASQCPWLSCFSFTICFALL